MIDLLRRLSADLSARLLSTSEAVAILGAATGGSEAAGIAVATSDPALESAFVVADPAGGFSHAELRLASALPIRELTEAFGEPEAPPRVHWDRPQTLVYRVGGCRLIAAVESGDSVRRVTLQPVAR